MNRDPIPTFRRAGRAGLRVVTSRRFWKRTARVVLATVAIVAFGYAGALVSRSRCSSRTRESLPPEFVPTSLKARWLDASEVVEIPFKAAEGEERSAFAPSVTFWLAEPAAPESESERQKRMAQPPDAWGYVRCRVPLPFLVRAHYVERYSFPRQGFFGDSRWTRSGGHVEGVMTYIAFFGLTIRINDWCSSYIIN